MEELLQQILEELKCINKKLDAVTPSSEIDTNELVRAIQHRQKARCGTSLKD